jgi:hypothetical protein
MTSYMTATLAAARNDELHRRGARPLPLSALDAIHSSRWPNAIMRYFRSHASPAQAQPLPCQGLTPRGA